MEMYCVMPPRIGYSHARELIDCSFPVIPSYMGIYKRKFTNNYRKMHGLPMTRYRALDKVRRRYVIWTKKYDPYIFRQPKLYERTLLDYDCLANKHPYDWCNHYMNYGQKIINQNAVVNVVFEEKENGDGET